LTLGLESTKDKYMSSRLPSGNTAKGSSDSWKFVLNLWIDHTSLYGSQPAIVFPYVIGPLTLSSFKF
jgi:hypothetical protein